MAKRNYGYGADSVYLSDEDLDRIAQYQAAYKQAEAAGNQAGMDAAHQAAEDIRAGYGYSGGAYGNEFIQSGGYRAPDTPDYLKQYQDLLSQAAARLTSGAASPTYTDPWSDEVRQRYDAYANAAPFSYDPASDPLWQSYRKQYAREGQRAAEDTLGSYAAMTGGMPSTAAVTASQQAGNYYAAQAADRLPQLREQAYNEYLNELNRKGQVMSAAQGMSNMDYNRFLDRLSQWNTEQGQQLQNISALSGLLDQGYGQYNTDRSFGYGVYADALARESQADSTAYERGQAERSEAQDRVNAYLAAGGDPAALNTELAAASGYTDAELAALQAYYAGQRTGGRSGGGYGGSRAVEDTGTDWSGVEDWVSRYGEDSAENYIKEHYKELGRGTQSEALAAWQNHVLESGFGQKVDTITSASQLGREAVAILNQITNRLGRVSGYDQIDPQMKALAGNIENALTAGEITEAEADFLLRAIGY